jgi:hypothetical protein
VLPLVYVVARCGSRLIPRINSEELLLYHNGTLLSREASDLFNQKSRLSWLASYFDTKGKVKACNPDLTQIWHGISNEI